MKLHLTVESRSVVDISEIAGQFAELSGDEQAVFLQEIFDALEHKCKTEGKFESQLSWIGVGINRFNFKRLKYVFESLVYFSEDKKS